tara:strand:+ start:174 stop:926 length:753 start_codon:yes stop_codon:yes gene_type:complete
MKLISKKNCTSFVRDPFTIFEIKDFLPEKQFLNLLKSFPDESLFSKQKNSILTLSNNEKIIGDKTFNNFLRTSNEWNFFFDELNKKEQVNSIFNLSVAPNFKSRGFSALKKWVTRDQNFFLKKLTRKVKFQLNFFIHKQNAILYPHTDAKSKLISLVYYLSDNSDLKKGTDFWTIYKNKEKWKNLIGSKFNDNDEIMWKEFNEDCKITYKCEFEPNKLIGFFRNDESIHSVSVINKNVNASRKSVSIFIA